MGLAYLSRFAEGRRLGFLACESALSVLHVYANDTAIKDGLDFFRSLILLTAVWTAPLIIIHDKTS